MPQGAGIENTAPPPIPGGFGNPTGANNGVTGTPTASPLAVPQAYGSMPVGAVPTTPTGTGGFPANGVTGSGGTTTNPELNNLSSGFANPDGKDSLHDFQRAYGDGPGQMLYQMMTQGLFNPQVAQAMIAAMQPQINRGLTSVESAFGAEGARFSSSAQIGVGDYESQAVLGENQVLANMYQQDQTEQLQLLESMMPTLHQEVADNSGNGWLSWLLGGSTFASAAGITPKSGAVSGAGGTATPMPGSTGTGSPTASSGAGGISPAALESMMLQSSGGATAGGAASSSDTSELLLAMGLI